MIGGTLLYGFWTMATALTAALGWSAGVGGLEQVGVQTGGAVLGGANDVRSADAGGAGGVRDVGADAGGTSSVDGLRTPALPPHVQSDTGKDVGRQKCELEELVLQAKVRLVARGAMAAQARCETWVQGLVVRLTPALVMCTHWL